MKKAVNVGYVFNIFDEKDLTGINLKEVGRVFVELHGDIYPLLCGETFEDSKKVDVLLDKYGEHRVLDHITIV